MAKPGPWPLSRSLVLVGLAGALLAAVYAAAGGFAFDVRIPEARLNETVAARLPFERKLGPVVWKVEAAQLSALDKGRVGFDARLHGAVGAHEAQVHVVGDGVLTYRDGAFRASDLKVASLTVAAPNADTKDHPPSILSRALGELGARNERLKAALDEIHDEAIATALKHCDVVLDAIFVALPVYRLHDDFQGGAVKWVLVSVRADGHDFVATLDPLGSTLRYVAAVVAALLLIYAALCALARSLDAPGAVLQMLLFWW